MTKEELVALGARAVRSNPQHMSEYIRLYKEDKGVAPNCAGCSFSSIFNQWSLQIRPKHKKQMTAVNNTFTLKEKKMVPVPFSGGRVITKDSEDQLVIDYINHKYQNVDASPAMKQARADNFFELPEGFSLDGEKTDDELTLKALRVKYADRGIKATSKASFLEQLNSNTSDEEE